MERCCKVPNSGLGSAVRTFFFQDQRLALTGTAMANWRRVFQPGGTYAFTLVTEDRVPLFSDPMARSLLRQSLADCRARWPFEILAIVSEPHGKRSPVGRPELDCRAHS